MAYRAVGRPWEGSVTSREHLQALVEASPADALLTVPAAWLRDVLDSGPVLASNPALIAPLTWRERLWTVPAETRLGTREAAEAIGRPVSWVYRRTGEHCPNAPLPHRRLDGELVFLAGELRAWLEEHEVNPELPPRLHVSRARRPA
jgi:hypothetical protein